MKPTSAALVTAILAPAVRAAQTVAPGSALPAAVPDLAGSTLQMGLGLIFVLCLLLASLWLLKRLGQPHGSVAGFMRVVTGIAIGPRERVVILELGNTWLVLGVAPGQVTTLAEIPRQDLPSTGSRPAPGELPAWLRPLVSGRGSR